MRYATWEFDFIDEEGYTADQEIRKRGFEANGILYLSKDKIFGQYEDNADVTNLEKYNFTALTEEEAVIILTEMADKQTFYTPLNS